MVFWKISAVEKNKAENRDCEYWRNFASLSRMVRYGFSGI